MPVGDVAGLKDAIEQAATNMTFRAGVPKAASRLLHDVLDVRHLAIKIENDLQQVIATKVHELQ